MIKRVIQLLSQPMNKRLFLGGISVFIIFVLIFFGVICFGRQEEIKLAVAPEIFEIEVERGEVLRDEIKIFNQSKIAIPIETSITNFGSQEETGTITFFEEPQKKKGSNNDSDISYNARKWIKIKNPNFILDPGEKKEIEFEVNIPENAEPGGKYAVILLKPKLPSFYFEERNIKAFSEIGILFLFSVRAEGLTRPPESMTIVQFAIPENLHLKKLEDFLVETVKAAEKEKLVIVETSHLPFILKVKNNDIYHIKMEGRLAVSRVPITIFGNNGFSANDGIIGEMEIRKTTILPGKSRKFPIEFKPEFSRRIEKYLPRSFYNFLSENFFFGKYRAHLLLKTKNDKIEKDIEFWIFPWKIVLIGFFVALSFLLFLLKFKRRIKSAILVFFCKDKKR